MPKLRLPKHDVLLAPSNVQGVKRRPEAIIIHTTESGPRPGIQDRHEIVRFLARRGISVPFVIDDDGITRAVAWGRLGYGHAKGLSGVVSGIEQVGTARWTRRTWLNSHRKTVRNTGRVVATIMHELMDLPVTRENLKRYVDGHANDKRFGGDSDHWDPGPGYPYDVMFEDAIAYAKANKFRVVATKDDRKIVRRFERLRRALRVGRALTKKGFRVVIRRKKLRKRIGGDLESSS